MSGIFLDNEYTDELGLLYFMDNSIASVLHNTSYNAIILELKLNRGVKSPYLTVEYDETENNLKLKEIKEIVFKIVIISSKRVEIKPLGLDKRTIDLENFNHEIVTQKLIFYSSYMVDFQMKAVCPDIICSFFIKNKDLFIEKLRCEKSEENFIIEYINQSLEQSLAKCKSKCESYIGCIVMEKIDCLTIGNYQVFNLLKNDFGKLYKSLKPVVYKNKKEEFINSLDIYLNFLISKANVIINLDKLHYTGFVHHDLHIENSMAESFKDIPDIYDGNLIQPNYNVDDLLVLKKIPINNDGLLIDFETSRYINKTKHSNMIKNRNRNFDNLDSLVKPYINTRDENNYINKYIIELESTKSQNTYNTDETEYNNFSSWNNLLFKTPLVKDIGKKSYRYIPIDIMNRIDLLLVQRGLLIRELLLSKKIEEEKEIQAKIYEYIEECIKEDSKNSKTKYLFTKITGAKTMLINYLKLLNIHENCDKIITDEDTSCIEYFNIGIPLDISGSKSSSFRSKSLNKKLVKKSKSLNKKLVKKSKSLNKKLVKKYKID